MSAYHVVLLIERPLTAGDAERMLALHEGIEDPVVYDVLLPVEDTAAEIEAAMGTLGTGEYLATPALAMNPIDVQELQQDARDRSTKGLDDTLAVLRDAGATAQGEVVTDPVPALAAKVKEVDGREAIILTEPHVVAEFFHLDWTAQARKALGVPVLHLIEHENFDEQAGPDGEGAHVF
jgi:hypothetical protein